jgi:V/A-type H+-transporting ATPase subunit F
VVVAPGDGLGFRLAGARVEEIPPGEEAARLPPLLAAPDAGVLAVEQGVLARAPATVVERAARAGLPVLFPFTLPRRLAEPGAAESYVDLLVRRAIGYHVRLK